MSDKEMNGITQLDENQLDGVVGGAAVPPKLAGYAHPSIKGLPCFTVVKDHGHIAIGAEKLPAYCQTIQKKGRTTITFQAEGKRDLTLPVSEVLAMYS